MKLSKRLLAWILVLTLILPAGLSAFAATPASAPLQNVPLQDVSVTAGFFRDYIRLTICKIIPAAIDNVEKGTGGMPNIINAAKLHRAEPHAGFSGAFYVDSDVHKVLESMCLALTIDPMEDRAIRDAQQQIRSKLETWIPYYVDAQDENGYFDTYYILQPHLTKYSDVNHHELYCMGHFIEAALAHYACTGGTDTRLFDMAIRIADHLAATFGTAEGLRKQIPGHQEIELALLKLSLCCRTHGSDYAEKAQSYRALAAFFLDMRGNYEGRTVNCGAHDYWQDHLPVEQQTSAVGHAVRAQYMYTAMAELSCLDPARKARYANALSALWNDVTHTKQYVTGGVGHVDHGEGFSVSYDLPNDKSYCETCAGIANMLWNRAMSKLAPASVYAEQIETDLYNAVLGCVNFDGNAFFYQNYLFSSDGLTRNAWYGTACCPPNLTRTLLSVGSYIYNISDTALYINQYISNEASVTLGNVPVQVSMESDFPNNGSGSLTLSMDKPADFTLYLRRPDWTDKTTVKLNGTTLRLAPDENGWLAVSKTWQNGDTIAFDFSMPVRFEKTPEQVQQNIGYAAVRRGPLVYCAEAADNSFRMRLAVIDETADTKLVWTDSLDGAADPYGVRDLYLLKQPGSLRDQTGTKPVTWTLVPFYARCNRAKGYLSVFLPVAFLAQELHQFAVPSASYTYAGDSPLHLNDGSDNPANRWTSWNNGNVLQNPWVQYDFETPVDVAGCKIWWYDDKGGVQLPDGFEIYYKSSAAADFKPVQHTGSYTCDRADTFQLYTFAPVRATSLRIVCFVSKAAAGIVEWKLLRPDEVPAESPATLDTPQQTGSRQSFFDRLRDFWQRVIQWFRRLFSLG